MKIRLVTLLLLIGVSGSCQTLNFWSTVDVCSTAYYGNRPRIALINETTPIVTFNRSGADPAVFVNVWNGNNFGPSLRLSPANLHPTYSNIDGPEIKTLANTVMIVFAAHNLSDNTQNIYLVKSTDAGITWSDTVSVVKQPDSLTVEFPDVVILPNGNPVVTYLQANPSFDTTRMMAVYSLDGGSTFSAPQDVSSLNPGMACECCPNSLVNNGDTVILSYRIDDNNLRDFYGCVSFDGGQTFTNGFRIDNSNWNIPACPTNGIDLLALPGKVLAVFPSISGPQTQIKSGSLTFPAMTTGPNPLVDLSSPAINHSLPALAGNGDTLCAVWHDSRNGSLDIFSFVSTTGLTGFSTAQTVNEVTTSIQKLADVVYANGYFHFVYFDFFASRAKYRKGSLFPNDVSENSSETLVSIFPNPATEILHLLADEKIERAVISDITGRELLVFIPRIYKISADISPLPAGMYFVTVETGGGKITVLPFLKN